MERWCHDSFAIEWLSWKQLAAMTRCSRGLRKAICGGDQPVLNLSDGRIAVVIGHVVDPLQVREEDDILDSHPDVLFYSLGKYLETSVVGKALFKPGCFHRWPSPANCIVKSLELRGYCVENCANIWTTSHDDDLVYCQNGYSLQWGFWQGVLELTTPLDWRKDPHSVRLTLHYGHNLDYAINDIHLRSFVTMLRLPSTIWRNIDSVTIQMTTCAVESVFRKRCLDYWTEKSKEAAVVYMEEGYEWKEEENFISKTLMDTTGFPWDGDFGGIFTYLYNKKAEAEDLSAFIQTWRSIARLKTLAYCLDCKAWVDESEAFRTENDDDDKDDKGIRSYGCWVVEAEDLYQHWIGLWNNDDDHHMHTDSHYRLLRTYGDSKKLFVRKFINAQTHQEYLRALKTSLGDCHFQPPPRQWTYDECQQCWRLEKFAVRWKKTCLANKVKAEGAAALHFPVKAGGDTNVAIY